MTAKDRRQRLIQQYTDDTTIPLGSYTLRDGKGNTTRMAYPKTAADFNNLSPGDELKVYLDQNTGGLLILPAED